MVTFDVETKEMCRLVRIGLENDGVRIESGAMYYMIGALTLDAQMPSVGGFLKSMVTKEAVVRSVVKGTGTLYLEPTYGEFTIFELDGDEWILDKGAYYASDMSVEVSAVMNRAVSGLFSGEGFFQTKVSGRGRVVVHSGGPLERIDLENDKLVVDGSFAVARSASLDFKVEKASKGLFSTFLSGEGIVNTFTGTGTVFISPVQHRDMFIKNQFASVHAGMSRSGSK
ncbi:MAG: AIM24 family protein [Lentisphaeria bacterium]|nr:AIM24 family protein [Lentisphaeria bacterium]